MIATAMNNQTFNATNVVALVTGANRGIGRAYAERLARSGARRVYAGARDPAALSELAAQFPGTIIPIELDVTKPDLAEAAARQCGDVNLLVNNAGIALGGGITERDSFDGARAEMEVNYFGTIEMTRAFAPILIANAPSAIINVLSIASLIATPRLGSYGATKAAALAATRTIRAELSPKGVHVLAVMPGYVDTDMAAAFDVEKITPETVVDATFGALAAEEEEVYPGARATQLADAFFSDHKTLEKQLANYR
jgi:short-subunit dehydrogenase